MPDAPEKQPNPADLVKAVESVLPSDLDAELQRGEAAFMAVAQHMANMGADGTSDEVPVTGPDGSLVSYRITVEFIGRIPA